MTVDWLLGVAPLDLGRPVDPDSEARIARDAELERIAGILQEQALKLQTLLSTAKKRPMRGRRPASP